MSAHDEPITDDDIVTRQVGQTTAYATDDADTSDTGDDSGDTSDTSDTGDDSGDTSDTSDTGDDSIAA